MSLTCPCLAEGVEEAWRGDIKGWWGHAWATPLTHEAGRGQAGRHSGAWRGHPEAHGRGAVAGGVVAAAAAALAGVQSTSLEKNTADVKLSCKSY